MPSWSVAFPGLNITAADMTYCHGITPSVCHVTATPLGDALSHGTLEFTEDGVTIISFLDCAVFRAITNKSRVRRGIRTELDILDRRWRWRYSSISGKYNVRDSGGEIIAGTTKTYEELIGILLDELGETGYEVDLPTSIPEAPPIDWSDDRADIELAKLIEFIGCIIHLGQDNLVHVFKIGDGPVYPVEPTVLIPNVDFVPLNYPNQIEIACGPTVYQHKLTLEAVGLDFDGSIKVLDELSYVKDGVTPFSQYYIPGTTGGSIGGSEYELSTGIDGPSVAISTVYRWYRIKELYGSGLALPGGDTIDSITNILPLLPRIVTIDAAIPGHDVGPLPFVSGTWIDPFTAKSLDSSHFRDFDLDLERGIVMFRDFVFDKDAGGLFVAADITLTASFHARATVTSGLYRQSYLHDVANGSAGDSIAEVVRDDLYEVNIEGTSNEPAIHAECDKVGDAYEFIYNGSPQSAGKWVGILMYPMAGNIHQFRWVLNAAEVVTYGGKNLEAPVASQLRSERRIHEIVSKELHLC